MKISKQQVGLAIVLGGGLCAIGVDRFLLRPEGGLSAAAAAVAEKVEASVVQSTQKAVTKEVVDRTSAAIADRLEQLPLEAVSGSRDAFAEPWKEIQKSLEMELGAPMAVAKSEAKAAPWTLRSVSASGGKVVVVLNPNIVLTEGVRTRDNVELMSATSEGIWALAVVRDLTTGKDYTLELNPQARPKTGETAESAK